MHFAEIKVRLGKRQIPQSFMRDGRVYRVKEIQESWRYTGAWWDGIGERTYFRVRTDKSAIYEICYDHLLEKWLICRIED